MEVLTEIIGNTHSPEWHEKMHHADVESIFLDQWTAQKSRFLAKSDKGIEYPVALKRQSQIVDGDILAYDPEKNTMLVLRLALNPVMVIELGALAQQSPEEIIRIAVELGHAIGNQHWPAVVKGTKVYVPLTVDKKVMESVMDTHHIENISYTFEEGSDVIPFMAPHEIRRLFGGASHHNHHIHSPHADHIEGHLVH
ncbi:MAG: urease accessory protein UreE [Duncaniella sp.]|nr:urease accessory protein UreE [Duncaniella sp.]